MSQSIPVQQFIRSVADLAIARLNDDDAAIARDCFLTYGAGNPNLRGVTYFKAWNRDGNPEKAIPFVEVCAMGQSDPVQLAGTTIHEIGHVLAGLDAGHSADWKNACDKLGLRKIKAAGTVYHMANFSKDIREHIYRLILQLEKAEPTFASINRQQGKAIKPAPCPAGIGTRGGKSRGAGSGSRMLKLACVDCGAVWRMSSKWAESATVCPCCQSENIEK